MKQQVCMYVCVLALVFRLTNRIFCALYCIIICGLSGFTMFLLIISYSARFSEKVIKHKNVCFDFLYSFCVNNFSF